MPDLLERITIEQSGAASRSCGAPGMTVTDVLEYLAGGMTPHEILADFPDLDRDDIRAVLAFAAQREHRLFSVS